MLIVNLLHAWSLTDKMSFHPKKCKVVSKNNRTSPLAILPFVAYHYCLSENLLECADSERDLGVNMNTNLNFNEHNVKRLTKANQQLEILKRKYYFVTDMKRRTQIKSLINLKPV